jgi:hypothetical protein
MQFTTLSVAFFAALATAHAHNPHHFHHRRQLNGTGTSAASGESTTLTIYTTVVHTETSCAPTVTDCPAATGGVVLVTDVIAITTVRIRIPSGFENATNRSSRLFAQLNKPNQPVPLPMLHTLPQPPIPQKEPLSLLLFLSQREVVALARLLLMAHLEKNLSSSHILSEAELPQQLLLPQLSIRAPLQSMPRTQPMLEKLVELRSHQSKALPILLLS